MVYERTGDSHERYFREQIRVESVHRSTSKTLFAVSGKRRGRSRFEEHKLSQRLPNELSASMEGNRRLTLKNTLGLQRRKPQSRPSVKMYGWSEELKICAGSSDALETEASVEPDCPSQNPLAVALRLWSRCFPFRIATATIFGAGQQGKPGC